MFGLGGVLVEVLRDVSFRAAPFDEDEALRMIAETNAAAVLRGVRGAPPGDLASLATALSRLSVFAAANAEQIESIDINPFLVRPAGLGVCALDAVVVGRPPTQA
jgi:acyl-CoA synthetase (NDP forming)